MIIVFRQHAQISNRLVSLSALIGFCLRNSISMMSCSLSDYRRSFKDSIHESGITISLLPMAIYRLISRLFFNRIFRAVLTSLPFIHILDQQRSWTDVKVLSLKRGVWIIDGARDWCASMPSVSNQEASIIRKVLLYHSRFHEHASAFANKIRKGCDLLIGVHARRGDYATHRNGCWYYSEHDYLHWINQESDIFRENKNQRVHYVVCSNEQGFFQDVKRADVSVSTLGSGEADQILLSMCDLIIGPPSTFSVWAAFLSDTKLLHIFARDQVLSACQSRRSTFSMDESQRWRRPVAPDV